MNGWIIGCLDVLRIDVQQTADSTNLFLLPLPFLKSFAGSRISNLHHANLLEQTVHLSGSRSKWRDHFLVRLQPNGTILTSSFSGSSSYRFPFEAVTRPETCFVNGSLRFAPRKRG